jgi:ABC-type transporter Mla maintaining outer membrane lipid asymmetry ATPase subunit MlaF
MSHLIKSMEFRELSFSFEGQDAILAITSLKFPLGEIVSLRGDRGAGRSTLLQLLAGLQIPTHGEFDINGVNVIDLNFEEFLPYRLKIGYTFDLGGLISNRTLNDNLLLPLNYHRICSAQEAQDRVNYYIDKFSLMKSRDMRPANVSGGVRKLTCLIRSLLLEPEVLLLDDLTVGLSKPLVELFCNAINDLRSSGKNHTVVFSSYDDAFVRQIETSSIYFEGGQIYLHEVEKKAVNL